MTDVEKLAARVDRLERVVWRLIGHGLNIYREREVKAFIDDLHRRLDDEREAHPPSEPE